MKKPVEYQLMETMMKLNLKPIIIDQQPKTKQYWITPVTVNYLPGAKLEWVCKDHEMIGDTP